MRRSTLAFSLLLSPVLWAQPAWLSAQGSHVSKSAKPVTSNSSIHTPTTKAHISAPAVHPSTTNTQYAFSFTDPDSAPTLGGNWVRNEQLTVQNGMVVYAQFGFGLAGTGPLIAALQQQYGTPTITGNVATWTSGDNTIMISGAGDMPALIIENKVFTNTHR
jgi:hypothetical protein